MSGTDPTARHGAPSHCPVCALNNELAEAIAPVGDLVAAATEVLSPADLEWGITHLEPGDRHGLLGELNLPPMRRPTAMLCEQAVDRLKRLNPHRLGRAAWFFTWPIFTAVLAVLEAEPTVETRMLVSALVENFPQGMVRLALARRWNNSRAFSYRLLEALFGDERLLLSAWASWAPAVLDACAVVAPRAEALLEADPAYRYRSAELDAADLAPDAEEDPDEAPSREAGARGAEAAGTATLPAVTSIGETQAEGPLERARAALDSARRAAAAALGAVEAGEAPGDEHLHALADVGSVLDDVAHELGVAVPPPPTFARLEAAAAEQAGTQRARLAVLGAARCDGPGGEVLAELGAEAAALASYDTWTGPQASRAEALVLLADLIDAALRGDDEQLLALDGPVRSALDSERIAPVLLAAARGRIAIAGQAPAPEPATQPVGETPAPATDAPHRPSSLTDSSETPRGNDAPEPILPAGAAAATTLPSEASAAADGDTAPATIERPAVSPPQAAQAVSSDKAGLDEEPEDEEPDDALASREEAFSEMGLLVGARRLGAAAWLADAVGLPERATAFRAAALAQAMRSPTGACVTELDALAPALAGHALDGDRPAQLLALVAAVRSALLLPHGQMTGLVAELGEKVGAIDGLSVLCNAVTKSALRGLSLTAELLPAVQDVATLEQRVQEAVVSAAGELERPNRTNFARGSAILADWQRPDDLLGRLLDPVVRNDAGRRPEVVAEVLRLRDRRALDAEIDRIDSHRRGHGSRPIEGLARRMLVERVQEAVMVASNWADAAEALAAHRPSGERWQDAPLRELRSAVTPERERVLGALHALALELDDPIMAGVATAAAAMVGEIFTMLDGTALEGGERAVAAVLDDEMLKGPLPVDESGRVLAGAAVSEDNVLLAVRRTWVAGFEARCAAGDFVAAPLIVDRVAAEDPAEAALLRERCDQRRASAADRLGARRRPLLVELASARRRGFLDEDAWRDLSIALEAARPERADLGAVERELDAVVERLSVFRAEAQAAFREEFAEKCAVAEVAARRGEIERLADQGDLATARDVMARAEAGDEAPTTASSGELLAAFFPAVPASLPTGLSEAMCAAAEAGGEIGAVSFAALTEGERVAAGRGLRAWSEASHLARRPQWLALLAPALRLLGLEADAERNPAALNSGPDRRWVDLTGVRRTGKALVPAFGATSGADLRVLLCWGSPEPATLLGWVAQDTSDKPVVVLHFSTLSAARRRQLAEELRRHRSRPVIVVDDAATVFLAAHGAQRFESTIRVTVPFAHLNPYEPFVAGGVAPEMFYGRSVERSSVTDARGTSLIYGGRQLGKSALLRAAARRFEETPGYRALYIDLAPQAIAQTKRPELLWELVADALVAARVVPTRPARRDLAEAVEDMVRAWLEAEPQRRLLLLLDESDQFFDVDAEGGFAHTARLRRLMDSTNRRMKVVFAGLHQVQRFASIPNQPLAHLGDPQVIGPLAAQPAFDLLHDPLEALGFTLGDDGAARLMASANYQPMALQIYGQALVDVLLRKGFPETMPQPVADADIEAVLADPDLADKIHQRFELTLRLDPRYQVIGLVVAHRAVSSESVEPISTRELRDECIGWWPAGFSQARPDEFRSLVEEMAGLGILASVPGGWQLRSPNVLRMFGTLAQIEDALIAAEGQVAPGAFAAAEARRILDRSSGLRSPLAESQLGELVALGRDAVSVVLGSEATGVGDVARAVEAAAAGGRTVLVTARRRSQFESLLKGGAPGEHRVVLSVLGAGPDGVKDEACAASLAAALDAPPPGKATRSVVLVVSSRNLPWWPELLSSAAEVNVVELRRHTMASLWVWAVDVESAFQDERGRRELLEITGGWPLYVERAAQLSAQGMGQQEIIPTLAKDLASLDGAVELLDALGIDGDPALAHLWDLAVDLVDSPVRRGELVALADGVHPLPDGAVSSLVALGMLEVGADGTMVPEALAAAAWLRRRAEA